jgi:hypothetical protein
VAGPAHRYDSLDEARSRHGCERSRKLHRPDHQKCTGLEAHATIASPPLSFCLAA